jgi:hypothetical protein
MNVFLLMMLEFKKLSMISVKIWLCGHIVVVGIGRAHILLTFDSVEQSCSFLTDPSLLFRPIIPLLLYEVIAKLLLSRKLTLAEADIDTRGLLLLLVIVDVDVDGSHAVRRRRTVTKAGTVIIVTVFILTVLFLWFEGVVLPR